MILTILSENLRKIFHALGTEEFGIRSLNRFVRPHRISGINCCIAENTMFVVPCVGIRFVGSELPVHFAEIFQFFFSDALNPDVRPVNLDFHIAALEMNLYNLTFRIAEM